MTTWRQIRQDILNNSASIATILRGPSAPVSFYQPLISEFAYFENVLPEEIESMCDSEMRYLLSGYQTDNIRIRVDDQGRPVELTPNPTLDPYMRSAIGRFFDVVRDLYIIRVFGHEIRVNLLKSRIARVIVFNLTKKTDEALNAILVESWTPRDEGFHDGDFGLNNLTRSVAAIRPRIRVYADIVQAIYEKDLCGGEIVDLLEEKVQRIVSDRQDLEILLRDAWKIYFELAGSWISRGVLDDPNMEFFIWPRDRISPVNQSRLDDMLMRFPECAEALKTSNYIFIPELCPIEIRSIMTDIYRCGRSVQHSKQTDSFNWSNVESEARFIQKVRSLSADMSQTALNKLKFDGHLTDFVSCFHMTLLNSPWLSEVAGVLCAKELTQRKYNEVAEGVLKSLTHLTLHRHIGHFPFLKNFKFVKANTSLFEALYGCNIVAESGSGLSSVSQRSGSDTAMLPEHLSIAVQVPSEMIGIFTMDTIEKCCLLFRLQLRIHLAGIVLDECRLSLPRTGAADTGCRLTLKLLNCLSVYLLRFRTQLVNAINDALRHFNVEFAKASRVEDVSTLQFDTVLQIFKDASLTEKHIRVVEDLMLLIDAFAFSNDLDTVQEHYNVWLESVESSRFLGNDLCFQ